MSFGWDYPPGVTGNEPQISGEWPCECDRDPHCKMCEGKGYIDYGEKLWDTVLDCPNCCKHTLELFTDDWVCSHRCEGPDSTHYTVEQVIVWLEDAE
jgi:hypothetical protein